MYIEILYCDVCHTDVHQARDEWGGGVFPMVPRPAIFGRLVKVGSEVKNCKAGNLAVVAHSALA